MTMPHERTRALRWGWEFLNELRRADTMTAEQKGKIDEILLTYPCTEEIEAWARENAGDDDARGFGAWLEPEPDNPITSRNRDIPTSVERAEPLTEEQRMHALWLAFKFLRIDLMSCENVTEKQRHDRTYVLRHFPEAWDFNSQSFRL